MPPTIQIKKMEDITMNMNNYGVLRGRLVANPVVFANTDSSSKVKFTIAAENNFKSRDGKRESQMIPVEAYTKDFDKSPFSRIHKGDKVSISYSLRTNNYVDKNTNNKVYSTVVFVEEIMFDESKSVTEARLADNVAKEALAATEAGAQAAAEATL